MSAETDPELSTSTDTETRNSSDVDGEMLLHPMLDSLTWGIAEVLKATHTEELFHALLG